MQYGVFFADINLVYFHYSKRKIDSHGCFINIFCILFFGQER